MAKSTVKSTPKTLDIIKNDPWLKDYEVAIVGRHRHAEDKIAELTQNGKCSLSDFASGYLYFGLHRTATGWVFREWAPHATEIYLIGDFNDWKESPKYKLKRIKDTGNWEIKLRGNALKHGDLYKLKIHWDGGCGERIPAWCRRVVQDEQTKIFSAQVWAPEQPYVWKKKTFRPNTAPLLIYECHIGMAQDAEKVGSYNEFRENVLPRIAADGYNCIQIMAIQEHPYYGSFGYHVSSFFAASSRFGTPEELKRLIDEAHKMGIAVIMDIVHSHAVKNEVEGLGNLPVTPASISIRADGANTRRGTVCASITARTKSYTSCCPTANSGWTSTISTVSVSTVSRLCSITATGWARRSATMGIISTGIKTTMPSVT